MAEQVQNPTGNPEIDALFPWEFDGERFSFARWPNADSILKLSPNETSPRYKWDLTYYKQVGYGKSYGSYETDAEMIEMVRKTLKDHGIEADSTNSGKEANP